MRELLPFGGHRLYDWLVARPLRGFYAKLAKEFPVGRVLDVGCGPGHLAAILHKHGREVVALDKDPAQVAIARRNYPDLDVRRGDVVNLRFDKADFDVIVTSESFHHWTDPAAGVAQIARVLDPDGVFIIIEGAGDVSKAEVGQFMGRKPWPGLATIVRWVFRVHGFTPSALEAKLMPIVEARFRQVKVRRVSGWWVIQATEPI